MADNIRDGGLDAEPGPAVYVPFAQFAELAGAWRSVPQQRRPPGAGGDAHRATGRADSAHRERDDPGAVQGRNLLAAAPNAVLVSLFAILAVIIAAVGIAGVLGFSVSARTHEIGVRMSLGAGPGRVQRMILWEGGMLLAGGLVLGVGGASFAVRVMRGLLFGVAPHDPSTLIGVAVMMAAVGVAACWIPAVRAARIDPAIAIRAE